MPAKRPPGRQRNLASTKLAILLLAAHAAARAPRAGYDRERARGFAQECLAKQDYSTTGSYPYPADAAQHFEELHNAYAALMQTPLLKTGLHKSWGGVEEAVWTPEYLWHLASQHFFDGADPAGLALEQVFGPYVPLFFHWTDIHRARRRKPLVYANRYPAGFLQFLHEHLRKDVLYITAVQSDLGLAGRCEISYDQFPNVLVLSSGGYGHVPIPLFPQPGSNVTRNNAVPVAERRYLVSYVGSKGHAPHFMRPRMIDAVTNASDTLGFAAVPHYKGPDWRQIMSQSRVSLAPRGFGRTAYHLVECIQAGLVPVHVYTDVPWVPYQGLFERDIGFVVQITDIGAFLERLHAMAPREFRRRERQLLAIYDAYFSPDGAAIEMLRLMLGQATSLECVRLPPSIRDTTKTNQPTFDFDGALKYYPSACA